MKLIYDNEIYKKYYKIVIEYLLKNESITIKQLPFIIINKTDGFVYNEMYSLVKSMSILNLIKIDTSHKPYIIRLYGNIDYDRIIKNNFKFVWSDQNE